MVEITHRELRNNSGEILRRVAAGESIRITNNGQPAAIIGPVDADELTRLAESGKVRLAQKSPSTLTGLKRVASDISTTQIIADARGKW